MGITFPNYEDSIMENMFRSIFMMFAQSAQAITMTMTIINSLARAGVERAVVVESKSIAAAALSELDNANVVALRLSEITDVSNGISADQFNKAKNFLSDYKAKRTAEITGTPIPGNTPPVEPEPKSKK